MLLRRARSVAQDFKPVRQALENLIETEMAGPRRGEFQRQGQSVEALTDRQNRCLRMRR